MKTLKTVVLNNKLVLIVCIVSFIISDSYSQKLNNLNIDSGSFPKSSLYQPSTSVYRPIISTLDTTDYSLFLNLFRRRQDLFLENKTYFFVNNESLTHQLSIDNFDLLFNKYQTDSLKIFIQQHSSNISHSLSDFVNSSNTNMLINLATGSEVVIKKDFGALMITDNKNYESIINGHMYLNNCSIFFIQILLK